MWERLFFCDLVCETVFLCRRAILLGCSHGTFARLRSVVLTFAHGVFWSYSRRLSLHNHAVVCLPEQAISFERQTGGADRHNKAQFVAGFRLGAKTDLLERMFAPKKRRRSAKAKSRKKAERDALHGVLMNVWRKVCKTSSRTQMWFIVWVFDRIGSRACIGVCCRTLPRKDRLTGNRLTSHLCTTSDATLCTASGAACCMVCCGICVVPSANNNLWRMDEVLLCVFDGIGSRACIDTSYHILSKKRK